MADHSFDAIETHRIAVANSAIVRTYPVYDPIKQHELAYGTAATVVPVYPVYDPIKQHELAYGTAATVVPVYPVYDPIKQHELAYGTAAAGVVDTGGTSTRHSRVVPPVWSITVSTRSRRIASPSRTQP